MRQMGQQPIVGHTREDMVCMKGMHDNMGRTKNDRCTRNENCYYIEENQHCISKNTIMNKLQSESIKNTRKIGRSDRTLFSHEPSSQMHILPARKKKGNGYHLLQSIK